MTGKAGRVNQESQNGGTELLGLAAPSIWDGSFEGRFPGTSCQATIGVVPTGRGCSHFATASSSALIADKQKFRVADIQN
jgi:hypothetical protein